MSPGYQILGPSLANDTCHQDQAQPMIHHFHHYNKRNETEFSLNSIFFDDNDSNVCRYVLRIQIRCVLMIQKGIIFGSILPPTLPQLKLSYHIVSFFFALLFSQSSNNIDISSNHILKVKAVYKDHCAHMNCRITNLPC